VPPFQANSLYDMYQAHISRDADPLNLVRPEVPAELAALVAKMMAKDPARRFQTPGEVAQALTPFFKKGNTAFKNPQAEVSQAGQKNAGRPFSTPTQPATDSGGPVVRAKRAVDPTVPEGRWESLIDFKEADSSIEETPAVAPVQRPPWVWPSVAVGVLILGLFAAWLGGVFKVKTSEGVIVLENVPKNSEILVDGDRITFAWPGGGKPVEIRAVPGQRRIEVKKDGFTTFVKELTVKTGESQEVTVRLDRLVVEGAAKKEPEAPESTADEAPKPPVPPVAPSPADNSPLPVADRGWVSLFNGRDTAGWKTHPKQPGNWRVENGVLIGSGPQPSHLYSERGDYKDFHLRVEARINDGGNSGVYFRTPFGPVRPVSRPVWADGYEAQINSTHWNEDKTGSLRAGKDHRPVTTVHESPVPPGQWFRLEIIADGNHIIVMVDQKITTDYFDYTNLFRSGHLTLSSFGIDKGTETVVEFRKVEIKESNGMGRASGSSAGAAGGPAQTQMSGSPVSIVADPFQPGSVWETDPGNNTFTVLERQGERFKALFVIGRQVREVSGTIKDGRLRWLGRDVKAIAGSPGGDNEGEIKGNEFAMNWSADPGPLPSGRYKLRLKVPASASPAVESPARIEVGKPSVASAAKKPGARPGGIRHPADAKEFLGKHYKVFPQELTWHEARLRCQRLGGHLAVVTSEEENRFLTSLLKERGLAEAWIGATDERVEGRWVWVDGTPMGYSNWGPQQPNNKQGLEHYVVLRVDVDGKWSDQPNASNQHHPGFVCQWD
jgi:hypothetical protein